MKLNKLDTRIDRMLLQLPIISDWVKYKGIHYFAHVNYEATKKAGKPMFDMSYCATKSMNGVVLFICQYDMNKFEITK